MRVRLSALASTIKKMTKSVKWKIKIAVIPHIEKYLKGGVEGGASSLTLYRVSRGLEGARVRLCVRRTAACPIHVGIPGQKRERIRVQK